MNEAVKNSTAADWSFVEQWLAHGFVSWLSCQSIIASIKTGQLEHGNETVEELIGQLLVQWRRTNLDSSAAEQVVPTTERLR